MKFLAVCAFLIFAVSNIRADFKADESFLACKEEAGASDADFAAMLKHQAIETKEGRCMLACVLKKLGLMSDEGKLVKDTSIELSKHLIKDEEKKAAAAEIIEACEALDVSDDHCEAAEEYSRCVTTEFEKKGITSTEELA